jgi:hypothetical protein
MITQLAYKNLRLKQNPLSHPTGCFKIMCQNSTNKTCMFFDTVRTLIQLLNRTDIMQWRKQEFHSQELYSSIAQYLFNFEVKNSYCPQIL